MGTATHIHAAEGNFWQQRQRCQRVTQAGGVRTGMLEVYVSQVCGFISGRQVPKETAQAVDTLGLHLCRG